MFDGIIKCDRCGKNVNTTFGGLCMPCQDAQAEHRQLIAAIRDTPKNIHDKETFFYQKGYREGFLEGRNSALEQILKQRENSQHPTNDCKDTQICSNVACDYCADKKPRCKGSVWCGKFTGRKLHIETDK